MAEIDINIIGNSHDGTPAIINSVPFSEGIGRYANQLEKRTDAVHYYINKNEGSLYRMSDGERIKIKSSPVPSGGGQLQKIVNILYLSRHIPTGHSVYHIADQNMSILCHLPRFDNTVLTVHDLAYQVIPQHSHRIVPSIIYSGISKSDEIITISESTKQDLKKHFDVTTSTIPVIYNGVGEEFRPVRPDTRRRIRQTYGLNEDGRYILHIGDNKPRKNIPSLLKGFYNYVEKKQDDKVELIRTTGLGDYRQQAVELGIDNRIRNLGYVPEEDLPGLYSVSSVLLTTSQYEGFGFPAAEAMACGTPVIASNLSSLPEVVGNAGILVNPDQEREIAEALDKVLSDKTVCRRLVWGGLNRVKKFSWTTCAKRTKEVYLRFSE